MRTALFALLASLALLGARRAAHADEELGAKVADLHRALEVLLVEPLALEVQIEHYVLPTRREFVGRPHMLRLAPTTLTARVAGSKAWALTISGALDLTFVRDGAGHLLLERQGSRHLLVQRGQVLDVPLRVTGLTADPVPDPGALGADLARLLDARALAGWLRAQSEWSVMGPTRLKATAKRPGGQDDWGAVSRLDVQVRLSPRGQLEALELVVRRDLAAAGGARIGPGGLSRWRMPFPLAALHTPEAVAGPTLPEGHVDAVDPAHEVTTYTLRPAWQPPSERLLKLMAGAAERR